MVLVFGFGISNGCNTILQNFQGKSFALSRISKGLEFPLSGLPIVCLEVDIFLTKLLKYKLRHTLPLSTNPTKWSNTLKHFVGLALKGLKEDF